MINFESYQLQKIRYFLLIQNISMSNNTYKLIWMLRFNCIWETRSHYLSNLGMFNLEAKSDVSYTEKISKCWRVCHISSYLKTFIHTCVHVIPPRDKTESVCHICLFVTKKNAGLQSPFESSWKNQATVKRLIVFEIK